MNEPPDPGGASPQVSNYVTISYSGMDTEGSVVDTDCSRGSKNTVKRRKINKKTCKHCNKKRKSKSSLDTLNSCLTDCQCETINNPQIMTPLSDLGLPPPVPPLASAGVQQDVRPPTGRIFYQASDCAPFKVHVQREQSSPDENCYMNAISFGFFLKKNMFKNIIDGSVKKIGRNRICISFSDFDSANTFILSNTLKSNKYKAFVPIFNVTRMGVVRGIPADWSDEDIIENITVPIGCGKIIKVRRLKKKNIVNGKAEYTPIETVVLTFDGQILPPRVFLCYNALPVDIYIYPTVQCFNCCRYGHIKSQCRSTPRCFKCGQKHTGDTCPNEEEDAYCCICTGSHFATNRKCPEYLRQRSIKDTMAKNCISYAEAIKLHPPVVKSYADILTSAPSPNTALSSQYNTPISNSPRTSYKKTVFMKPKSPRKVEKGYDRLAHNSLIKDYDAPAPQKGCALINSNLDNSLSNLSLKELILTLITSLSEFDIISSPSNVALPKMNVVNKNSTAQYDR